MVSNLVTRTAKLIPRPKRLRQLPGVATAYSYEPESPAAHGLGGLYVTIEILSPGRPASSVVDTVIETVGSQYYNWEPTKPVPALERFERAVKATNAALADLVSKGNAGWIGRISAVIALLEGDELHITQTGSAEAHLYRGNVASHISDAGAKPNQTPASTFGSIASGKVAAGDKLLLSTPALAHAISRSELKTLINDNSATTAVHKLSNMVSEQTEADRMAAIVVEITTSDLLALNPLQDEPSEALAGQPEKAGELVKAAAIPVAKKLTDAGKQAGQKLSDDASTKVIPRLRATASLGASRVKNDVHNADGRRKLAFAAAAIILVLAGAAGLLSRSAGDANAVKNYGKAYSAYAKGLDAEQSGNKSAARNDFKQAQSILNDLTKHSNVAVINTKLSKTNHVADDPASITGLLTAIDNRFDELDQLVRLDATQIADLAQIKNFKPAGLEVTDTKIMALDANNGTQVYIVDPTTKAVTTASKPSDVGTITEITPSSAGDGVFVLTSEPAVWFVKAFDGSFVRQDISFGDWPKGRSLASYASNLYVLSDDSTTVTKHVRTAAGFAAGSDYFKDPSIVKGASAIAVDGSIYLAGGPDGIDRYLSGELSAKATAIPDTLKHPNKIASIGDSTWLFTFDPTSHRIGIFNNLESSITFNKQLSFKLGQPLSAAVDTKGSLVYAIVGSKLVSSTLPQ